MSPRTTPSEWARLFNFAGGGIVHIELFADFLVTLSNPSLFEAIATYLFPYGTHSLRPAAGDVPIQSFYFETDTTNLFQNQGNTWVQVASIGGSGPPPTLPGCRIYSTVPITLTNNVETKLPFDATRYDPSSMHSNSVNNTRITVPTTGIYLITATLSWAPNTVGERYALFLVNNTDYICFNQTGATPAHDIGYTMTTLYALTATDYVELAVNQNSGGNLNVEQGANYTPEFAVQMLSS